MAGSYTALFYCLSLAPLASAQDVFADDAFSDFAGSLSAEFAEFEQSQTDEWNSFVNEIRASKTLSSPSWKATGAQKPKQRPQQMGEYARDRRVKRTVDFENNQIRIAVIGQPSPRK